MEALKRFRDLVHVMEYPELRREHYEKPSIKRKKKSEAAEEGKKVLSLRVKSVSLKNS